ncbi:MAG: ATP-binding protein [Pseudomonadota bacterium]
MGFQRFSLLLTLRLCGVFAGLLLTGWLVVTPGFQAATLLAAFITVAAGWEVFRYVSKTNQEVTRFLDAARYADYGQRFRFQHMGAGFEGLGDTFTDILDRFREDRAEHERELRHLRALFEQVPVPLVSVYSDQRLVMWNNAARRLFGSHRVQSLADTAQFGDDFYAKLATVQPGERVLARFVADQMQQQLTISVSEITIGSESERLISMQNIQTELDGMQLSAWQDLVRVLTHEIMNTITPVTSLARTAVDLVDDARRKVAAEPEVVDELRDARDAVDTVARRADGLMNFVANYRQLTRPPTPQKTRFAIADLFADVSRIVAQDWGDDGPRLASRTAPPELMLYADEQMVEQILINLLRNAGNAVAARGDGLVEMRGAVNKQGHVIVEVCDNGAGIDPEIGQRVFVPFFTTRREGSGIGLALSRQMMAAHGGSISYRDNPGGGVCFALVF